MHSLRALRYIEYSMYLIDEWLVYRWARKMEDDNTAPGLWCFFHVCFVQVTILYIVWHSRALFYWYLFCGPGRCEINRKLSALRRISASGAPIVVTWTKQTLTKHHNHCAKYLHTADPVSMGRMSRRYTIFQYRVQARLSAQTHWNSCTCIWRNILVFHFVSSSTNIFSMV